MAINLNELSVDNIGSWPWPVKGAVIAMVCLLIIVAGYMLDIKAQQTELESVVKKEKKLKKTFEKKQKLAANLEEYQAQMKTIQEYFGALLRQLPESTEVPGLVEDISHVGLANGLTIRSIKLQAEKERDFYTELPIDIIVSGEYHNLGQFVSDVSALPRIVTLHDFSIKKVTKTLNDPELVMRMTAKTYRYTAVDEEEDE